MKKTSLRIIEKFPILENKLLSYEDLESAAEVLQSLEPVKRTFLRLAWFFENPDQEHFDLNILYKELDND